jgi:uncharacterized protein (DUF1778 family)
VPPPGPGARRAGGPETARFYRRMPPLERRDCDRAPPAASGSLPLATLRSFRVATSCLLAGLVQTVVQHVLRMALSPAVGQKLQTAAESAGRTVSEFVLESALVRADETLADRTHFGLDVERWKAFMQALDAPPREIPRLGRLLQEPSVFERGD